MSLLATILLGAASLLLLAVLARLESSSWSLRKAAIVSCLVALGAAGRIPASMIPGLQPATFFVILAGVTLGPSAGMAAGIGVPLLSNFFLGHGPWTLWQMMAWGLCGAAASLWHNRLLAAWVQTHPPLSSRENQGSSSDSKASSGSLWFWAGLAAYGIVTAYLFGALLNFWVWLAYYETHTWASWLAAWSLGLWPDTLHAVSNAFLILIAGPPCAKSLLRIYQPASAQNL